MMPRQDENTALIAHETSNLHLKHIITRIKAVVPLFTKTGLAIIGLGAGILYVGPAKQCSTQDSCGKWLADIVSQKGAMVIFTGGGLDFSAINAYFSAKSIEKFIEYERKQTSWVSRIGKGSAIFIYTATQNIPTLITSLTTATASWQTIITVAGNVPGNLYGTVDTVENALPLFIEAVYRRYRPFHDFISDLLITPTMAEKIQREQRRYYERMQRDFNKALQTQWYHLKTHPYQRQSTEADQPLPFLFATAARESPDNRIRNLIYQTGYVVAAGSASIISGTFMLNSYRALGNAIPHPALRGSLILSLSYASIYNNLELVSNFIKGFIMVLDKLITGRQIDNLSYHLRPNVAVLAIGLAFTLSALSYALMNVIFEMEFPNKTPVREGFRYTSNIIIIIYHIAGLYNLFEILFKGLTPNQHDHFMFKVQKEVEHIEKMTINEFIQFVETNPENDNAAFGLQPFQQSAPVSINDVEAGSSVNPHRLFSANQPPRSYGALLPNAASGSTCGVNSTVLPTSLSR